MVLGALAAAAVATMPSAGATTASDDAFSTGVDQPITVTAPGVLANDGLDPAEVTALAVVDGPDSGTLDLAGDGSFTYRPDPGFTGTDTFAYEVTTGGTATGPAELAPSLAPPTVAARLGDEVLFFADDGDIGSELWATDGTPAGTRLVADISPGGVTSDAIATERNEDLVALDGVLYFPADGPDGIELWRSDGTTAGTGQVVDLVPGPGDARPSHLAVVDGTLLFWASATGDRGGTQDRTLWAWDPTTPATLPVQQHPPQPGTRIGHPQVLLDDGLVHTWDGRVWRWDGTPIDISGPAVDESIAARRMVAMGGQAWLDVGEGQFAEDGLWRTDGTTTAQVTDDLVLLAGASDTHVHLQTPGAPVRAVAADGSITTLDGVPAAAALPEPDTTSAGNTASLGSWALLLVSDPPAPDAAPWVSDGTAAGSRPLLPGAGASTAFLGATSADGALWFGFDDGLWRSDGTPAGTTRVMGTAGGPAMVPVDGGSFLFHSLRGTQPGQRTTAWAIPYDLAETATATVTITVADGVVVDADEQVGVTDEVDVTLGPAPGGTTIDERVGVDDDVTITLGPAPVDTTTDEQVGVTDDVTITLGPAPVVIEVTEDIGVDDTGTPAPAGTSALGTVTPDVVAAGDTVVFVGDGFAADARVAMTLFSDPVEVGTTTADAAGATRTTVRIPDDTTPGDHTLVATGGNPAGQAHTVSAQLTVTAPTTGPSDPPTAAPSDAAGPPLARTGADTGPVTAAAVVAVVVGLALVGAGRRRRPTGPDRTA